MYIIFLWLINICVYSQETFLYTDNKGTLCLQKKNEGIILFAGGEMGMYHLDSITDEINIYNRPFYKQNISDNDFYFDTLLIANEWCELQGNDGLVFRAKVYKDSLFVNVDYPYSDTGFYTFVLPKEEYKIFKSLLFNLYQSNCNIIPNKDFLLKHYKNDEDRGYEFYCKIVTQNIPKEYYAINNYAFDNKEMFLFSRFTILMIKNIISTNNKQNIRKELLDVRNSFNTMRRQTGYNTIWTSIAE